MAIIAMQSEVVIIIASLTRSRRRGAESGASVAPPAASGSWCLRGSLGRRNQVRLSVNKVRISKSDTAPV